MQTGIKQPQQIILWGIGDSTKKYFSYLQKVGIQVMACVDTYRYGIRFCDMDVLSPMQFCDQIAIYGNIPIVPTGRGIIDNESRFIDICIDIANKWQLKNVEVLHPFFISNFIQFDDADAIFEKLTKDYANDQVVFLMHKWLVNKAKQNNDETTFQGLDILLPKFQSNYIKTAIKMNKDSLIGALEYFNRAITD